MSAPEDSDRLVQGTSNDAAISRESAARLGYIADPFIQHFVRHPQRRAPLINRGTFTRFQGVQKTLRQFLRYTSQNQQQHQTQNQVVILGSGLDTSYFLLAKDNIRAKRYFEIDFAEINAKKAATIYKKPDMRRLLPADTKVAAGGCELHSEEYCLLSGDLRLFAQDIVPRLLEHGFDTSAPTLFVSECVLIYLDPQHSDSIIDWITESVANAAILTYEQILPSDRFGQMMIENLRARGLELRGLMAYPSLESTRDRFLSRGWVSAAAIDLSDYHKKAIPQSELSRLARIEFLDEWEEFSLLAKHYAFTLAHTTHSKSFASIKLI
ncbi:carboxy methyl transferase for protein phosphatase 2A [Kickxella alabastrina]|uniref:Carboxy methyl transferase for protein phosphatase 2A n=1 Tax=Kickxella alabastrina TaxID=61397 RepID=A0ACC1I6B6_9FUNG|nr:carboxy methyl transferase for protein phosphatase 2A [Kickxella alabastrina]